jgi:hypothetical protein
VLHFATISDIIKKIERRKIMTIAIRISDSIIHEAQICGKIYNRSVPKQIEFWSKIGKIAEENPDMTYDDIRSILFALEEKNAGAVEVFTFSS